MSIEAQHAYRFGFLKSEAWLTIRTECLVVNGIQCRICGHEDFFNDVHHISYPKRWRDTKPYHTVTLCRECHELVHETKFPRIHYRFVEIKRLRWLRNPYFECERSEAIKAGFSLEECSHQHAHSEEYKELISSIQLKSSVRKSKKMLGRCFRCGFKRSLLKFDATWNPAIKRSLLNICGICAFETIPLGNVSGGMAFKAIRSAAKQFRLLMIDFPSI